jgi:hypothetical protein
MIGVLPKGGPSLLPKDLFERSEEGNGIGSPPLPAFWNQSATGISKRVIWQACEGEKK